jgi:hypothetical protein
VHASIAVHAHSCKVLACQLTCSILWTAGQWRDLVISGSAAGGVSLVEQNPGNFVSNFIPLWVRQSAAPHPAVCCQCCPQPQVMQWLLAASRAEHQAPP